MSQSDEQPKPLRKMPGESLNEAIQRIVAAAPPLSPSQIETLRPLLGGPLTEEELTNLRRMVEDREQQAADRDTTKPAPASPDEGNDLR